MKLHHFRAQNVLFAQNDIFFGRTIDLIFIYLLLCFVIQNFKKFHSYEDAPFLGPKWPVFPKTEFFQKSY